ncbi:MipA/OmpV family protein [Paralimibaculum aggregatum]|uniref:MipA/OmpV family protein n=1 Tax=Paralimibaculum aggregatum TaxID=3036245 RepID=A0ABQ6LPI8_9RHOB|nr:MipA/OmpV family protein [Limibaculum sp. NKW23]GMG83233.1 MipA/OmpV family protein [Limibaculum sp. NKW23]
MPIRPSTTRPPTAPLQAISALGILAALAAAPAAAQETFEGSVGLGAGFNTEYEGADEYHPIPVVPISLRYQGFGLQTAGQGVQIDVSGIRFIDFGPLVQYRSNRGSDVDDPVVALLPEVDAAVEIGGFVEINLPFFLPGTDAFTFIGRFTYDIADSHGGVLIQPGLRYSVPIGEDIRINLIGTTTFASEDYNETYFGVTPAASMASGLPVYDAGAGFKDISATLAGSYYFSEHWGVTAVMRYTMLVGDAADSPITELRGSRNQFLGGLALSYRF